MGPVHSSKLDTEPLFAFDCGRDDQNEFLRRWAWPDQNARLSTTYLLDVNGLVAGYITVCMDSLPLSRRERGVEIRYRNVSALKLAQLGVDRRFQGMGIGREAVLIALAFANRVSEQVGCRYVTLDAHPALEGWYQSLGFTTNRLRQQERLAEAGLHERDPAEVPVSMRFDLRQAA